MSRRTASDSRPGRVTQARVSSFHCACRGSRNSRSRSLVGADGGHALRWRESVHGQTGDEEPVIDHGRLSGLDDRRSLTPDLPVVAFRTVAQLVDRPNCRCTWALLRTSWVSAIHPPGELIDALTHDHGQAPVLYATLPFERSDVGDPRHRQHRGVLDGDETGIHRTHWTMASIGSNQLPDEALEHRRFARCSGMTMMHGHLGGGGDVHGSEGLDRWVLAVRARVHVRQLKVSPLGIGDLRRVALRAALRRRSDAGRQCRWTPG